MIVHVLLILKVIFSAFLDFHLLDFPLSWISTFWILKTFLILNLFWSIFRFLIDSIAFLILVGSLILFSL